ncbi:unnamed protein product, partial [Schistocephalus solidus]|uniref:Secreted protein n=1 Tax=Schistocephalus solidus TaxID=70667 RepID=A0A183SCV7_SCHSO
ASSSLVGSESGIAIRRVFGEWSRACKVPLLAALATAPRFRDMGTCTGGSGSEPQVIGFLLVLEVHGASPCFCGIMHAVLALTVCAGKEGAVCWLLVEISSAVAEAVLDG